MGKILKRYLKKTVEQDLVERMVFVGGPRQAGKTTFALTFLSNATGSHPTYLNWDNIAIRSSLLKVQLPANQKCIVLDEIHKNEIALIDATRRMSDNYSFKFQIIVHHLEFSG